MKTTVEIQDQLFVRAQRKARREGRAMRSVIEERLRLALDAESIAESYHLPDLSVGEAGSPDPLESMSWAELRDEIYGGRWVMIAVETTPTQAWTQLRAWQRSPTCSLIGETEDFFDLLQDYLRLPRVQGPLVHDARIAAICVAHGVEPMLTRDRDFSHFPQLTVRNPFSGV